MAKNNTTLRLILGDQLNPHHYWFEKTDKNTTYVLMEVLQETAYVKHHVQKVCAFFAAMRMFADRLRRKGHRVLYIPLDGPDNAQSFQENIGLLVKKHSFSRFEYMLPDEYRLDTLLKEIADGLPVPSASIDTQHFLSSRDQLKKEFAGKKRFLMESFYRSMRKKHNVLMEDGKPAGGTWNFDRENRNPYDGLTDIPEPLSFSNDVSSILNMMCNKGVVTFGSLRPEHFIWPVSVEQSEKLLRYFCKHGLPCFGTYQDAMTCSSWSLFHSRLSFSLNTKMLHPMDVINCAVQAWKNNRKQIGINQVEGFIRQVLGWREYMRGSYWALMPTFSRMNFFRHRKKLPHYFWDAQTRMNCMRHALQQSLEHAWAHHIQRLMVTGNFALLAGMHPDEVDAWYLGVYIDAVQWVEITNTRGMSQYADGGGIATKPYVSSAQYIHGMSDYCTGCFYSYKKKHGDGACPFNSLYWDFFSRHRTKLQTNPRIAMTYRTWDKMSKDEREKLLHQAAVYKKNLETL